MTLSAELQLDTGLCQGQRNPQMALRTLPGPTSTRSGNRKADPHEPLVVVWGVAE